MSKLRAISPAALRANIENVPKADPNQGVYKQRQQQIENRSGGNIVFPRSNSTEISDNYKNTLMDAIKFYQGEFKVTPKANIYNDPTVFDEKTEGFTETLPQNNGRYNVVLKSLSEGDEKRAAEITPDGIGYVPTHELGHVLYNTLFPVYSTDSSDIPNGNTAVSKGELGRGQEHYLKAMQLVQDSAKDVGANKTWKDEAKKITGYAASNAYETVAEALADYYYRKDKSAPLSRAIVKRLKSKGNMYGINQTGGVDLTPTSYSFFKNLRKYSPLK